MPTRRNRPDHPRPDEPQPMEAGPSKSARKREMSALQDLGAELAALSPAQLAAIDMPEALRSALAEWQRTRSHEGRRRQMQYIGKQMRLVDPAPLQDAVAALKLGSARETLRLHEAEAWRAELVAGDAALTRWSERFPRSDLQRLRSLVRAARAGQATPAQRHGRPWRDLFRFIKPWLDESPATVEDPADEQP